MATSSKAAMTRASDSGTRWVSSATGLLVEEPGSEQVGEHAGGHKQADDKTDDDGRALSLLHIAGLGGLDVAVIVPGTLDERRSGGFRGSGLLGLGGRTGRKTLVGGGIGRSAGARIEFSHNSS